MSSDSPRPSSSTPKKKKTPSKAGKPRASSSSSPSAKAPPIVAESGSPRFHVKISDAASAHKQTLRIVVAPNRVTALKLCVGDVVSVSVAGVKVGFGVIWTTAQNLAPGVAIVSQQLALNLGLATGDEVELNQSGATLQPLAKLVLKPTSKGSDSNWIDEGCQLLAREVLRK
ncbi:hypothetical protein BC830DRAFT_715663 [Chytriomyces sp. MP71]|nr:hypothetical protein BC830DRAFT_715663 [Chytriomyces sp. MP71]